MKKKIVGLCAIMLLASGCGKIPELQNGEQAIVSFSENGDMISVDDFYTKIKDSFGLQTLIEMIDTYVFESEFADYKDEAMSNAEAMIDAWIERYGSEEDFLTDLQSYGYQTIDAYKDALYINYLQSHAISEYGKLQITDKQIEDYYNNQAVGDVEISHILITSDAASDATDEEKEAAEETAKNTVDEIIKKLKAAKKEGKDVAEEFASLAKEYSDDDATKDDGGSLGRINYGDLSDSYDELIDAALKLDDGEFSTTVITTELGYHIIYKTKSYEKDSLEDLKDEIVEILGEQYVTDNSSTISLEALQYYRKKYGMEIQDDEMKTQYAKYIQSLTLSSSDDE
jgi:foldase protein PrsA